MNTANKITDWAQILQYYHSGVEEEREIALLSAIDLLDQFIWSTIWKHYPTYVSNYKEELYQEGVCGVLEGMKNFDLNKGKPTTHFYSYIIDCMSTFIAKHVKGTKSSYYLKKIGVVVDCIEKFEAEGIPYNAESIAAATNLSLETVEMCIAIKQGTDSQISYDSEEYTTAQGSQQISQSAEDAYFDTTHYEVLEQAMNQIDETTALLLKLTTAGWYSPEEQKEILGFYPKGDKATKKEISKALNISESEITVRIRKGLTQLKKILNPVKKPNKVMNESQIVITPRLINLDNMDIL